MYNTNKIQTTLSRLLQDQLPIYSRVYLVKYDKLNLKIYAKLGKNKLKQLPTFLSVLLMNHTPLETVAMTFGKSG